MSENPNRIELQLPIVLEPVTGCEVLQVSGATVQEALEDAFRQIPVLRHHLMGEDGQLRPHILCILNGSNLPRSKILQTVVSDGDGLFIQQAISGG